MHFCIKWISPKGSWFKTCSGHLRDFWVNYPVSVCTQKQFTLGGLTMQEYPQCTLYLICLPLFSYSCPTLTKKVVKSRTQTLSTLLTPNLTVSDSCNQPVWEASYFPQRKIFLEPPCIWPPDMAHSHQTSRFFSSGIWGLSHYNSKEMHISFT